MNKFNIQLFADEEWEIPEDCTSATINISQLTGNVVITAVASLPQVKYNITNTLTHCTSSNDAERIVEGNTYSATITADSGYTLTGATVSITMGNSDITSTAYNNGEINIANVSGDITISVVSSIQNNNINIQLVNEDYEAKYYSINGENTTVTTEPGRTTITFNNSIEPFSTLNLTLNKTASSYIEISEGNSVSLGGEYFFGANNYKIVDKNDNVKISKTNLDYQRISGSSLEDGDKIIILNSFDLEW